MSIGHAQTLTLSLNENNQGSYTCARLANNAPVLIVDMVIDSEYNVLLDGFAATISGSTESIQYSDITIWQNFGPERTEFASLSSFDNDVALFEGLYLSETNYTFTFTLDVAMPSAGDTFYLGISEVFARNTHNEILEVIYEDMNPDDNLMIIGNVISIGNAEVGDAYINSSGYEFNDISVQPGDQNVLLWEFGGYVMENNLHFEAVNFTISSIESLQNIRLYNSLNDYENQVNFLYGNTIENGYIIEPNYGLPSESNFLFYLAADVDPDAELNEIIHISIEEDNFILKDSMYGFEVHTHQLPAVGPEIFITDGEENIGMFIINGYTIPNEHTELIINIVSDYPLPGIQFELIDSPNAVTFWQHESSFEFSYAADFGGTYEFIGVQNPFNQVIEEDGEWVGYYLENLIITGYVNEDAIPGSNIEFYIGEYSVSNSEGQPLNLTVADSGSIQVGMKGDIDGNEEIDVVDLVQVIGIALETIISSEYTFWASDMNEDNEINVLDAVQILFIIIDEPVGRSSPELINLLFNNGSLKVDGDIAGIQLLTTGDFTITNYPNGWIMKQNGNEIIMISMDGSELNEIVFEYSGEMKIEKAIVADWLGNKVPTNIVETASLFKLSPAYPNPFNPITTIGYDLPHDSDVSIIVYDISGREVYSLVNEYQISGNYQITWNATDFSSGIYLVSMIAGNFTELQKIVLVK
ncbi:T9SS type A sorting domain-containing protein [bacterium]|nr:T9SS type A sorting domain-containing protein [bacterium]MBT4121808.1 T9SS type A sorting domain-containing protein [bacterium]MBT4335622.1 T9SS type A sorting domain-containing protein [bacterium]MBT5942615.1 T9SS type A sorting domain-containing protein [bacterium]MBT6335736.1 T9SS type A sorting domain-containing protein [bacterium]